MHRYRLTRIWDRSGPVVDFVMLNPSTADASRLDPTNRRCMGFARDWGFGGAVVTNIFALRSTDPRGLVEALDPVGPDNDAQVVDAARNADRLIAAWGTHGALHGRGAEVRAGLESEGVDLHVLRLTRAGHPAHPLYLPRDLVPVRWA